MAGALNRLGSWCLEHHGNVENILGAQNQDAILAFQQIFSRTIDKALSLLDTDRPRVALPLLEFFQQFMKAH